MGPGPGGTAPGAGVAEAVTAPEAGAAAGVGGAKGSGVPDAGVVEGADVGPVAAAFGAAVCACTMGAVKTDAAATIAMAIVF